MEKEILKVIPEFNQDMEVIAVEISCDTKELDLMDRDRVNELLNTQLGEEYSIQVEVTESQFQKLQEDGTVKITLETKTIITENNSVIMNEEDIEGDISSNKKTVFRDKNSYSFNKRVNKKGYEILIPYLEEDYVISEAIISRDMSSYKTWMWLDKDGDTVWGDVKCLTNIHINLLEKIADDIEINSTGMDNKTVVSIYKQEKDGDIFLKLEFEFSDGNIIGKYKLEKANKFAERHIDISF